MKRIFPIFLMITFLLYGCSTSYERDVQPGEVKQITLAQMETMMKEGQEFVVAFTQSMCGYCAQFHSMFETYRKDHNVVIYEVALEKETASPSYNRSIIQTYFPTFNTTPGIFYAKDGKCIDSIQPTKKLTEELFDNWVQKHKLDEKK